MLRPLSEVFFGTLLARFSSQSRRRPKKKCLNRIHCTLRDAEASRGLVEGKREQDPLAVNTTSQLVSLLRLDACLSGLLKVKRHRTSTVLVCVHGVSCPLGEAQPVFTY